MDKKIKWGVIGSGGIAWRRTIPEGIVPAKNAELVAVYDIDKQVNTMVASRFHALAATSITALLDSGIDAVYLATPVSLHLEQGIQCAGAGKHILCEKPLGLNVREAEAFGEACRAGGVLAGTAFMMGFSSQHKAAEALIREGKLGKPVYCRAQLSCWYPPIPGAWRQEYATSGGGSLIDMGSHCLDLLEMLFGEISRVHCFTGNNVHDYAPEDSAVVSLAFKNGALGTVDSYFCIPDNSSRNVLELYGSNGSILASGTIGQDESGTMTAFLEDQAQGYDPCQSRIQGKGQAINPIPVNTYQAEIEEFSAAILEDRIPLNSFARGLRSQQVTEACYESAKTGQAIKII